MLADRKAAGAPDSRGDGEDAEDEAEVGGGGLGPGVTRHTGSQGRMRHKRRRGAFISKASYRI